mgnify:CR=1 FL=1
MSKSMEQEKADANVSGELVFRLFNEIGIIAQLSTTRFERSLPYGMSRPQFSILNWFCRVDDQASPGRLAQAMEVTKGAITNSLKKLEAKNFITVSPDENSGRQKVVRLTPEGRRAPPPRLRAPGASPAPGEARARRDAVFHWQESYHSSKMGSTQYGPE